VIGKEESIDEHPFDIARREAFEEIGLPLSEGSPAFRIEHLCELPPLVASTGIGVKPCVTFLHINAETIDKTLPLRLNPAGVAVALSMPLGGFLKHQIGNELSESMIYHGRWGKFNERK